jgi:hypothetical protein
MHNNNDLFDDTIPFESVQSIGQGDIKNFAVPSPWGNIALAGGPYRARPNNSDYFGVKVAREINAPYSVKIDIRDFDVPEDDRQVGVAILSALVAARTGQIPYVGCMGGMGRTGTILAIMVKALTRASRPTLFGVIPRGRVVDPVLFVRAHYNAHACETPEQIAYVKGFDTTFIEDVLRGL